MSFRSSLLGMMFLPSLLLVGCGGNSDFKIGNGVGNFGGIDEPADTTETTDPVDGSSPNTSNVSYLPLAVLEKYKTFSGDNFSGDNLFQGEAQFPLIPVHMINPINATTLESITDALASDYKVTIDGIEIDPQESFPTLQKIIGMPVQLKTALVFDTSNSMDLTSTEYDALKAEAKSYIDKAQAHSNSIIANQKFVVWEFDEIATDLTLGFSNDANYVKGRIDTIERNIGTSSNLHKAIVKVVGRYKDTSATPPIDFDTDGANQDPVTENSNESDDDNDLVDEVKSDGIYLTQIVLFSSGQDSKLEFEQSKMREAIQSQGFLSYDPIDPTAADSSTSTENFTDKPVFYYVMGGTTSGTTYQDLSDLAENTTALTISDGVYAFSDSLIDLQLAAIDKRIDLDNQYIYRYAFLPRQGDHTSIFSSNSANFNYSFTTAYAAAFFTDPFDLTSMGTPYNELSSLVEITGPNGEFLPVNTASLQNVSTFKPATRWTTETYQAADYTWTITNGAGTQNADGSFTVTSIAGASATLEVENTAIVRNNETARITITN